MTSDDQAEEVIANAAKTAAAPGREGELRLWLATAYDQLVVEGEWPKTAFESSEPVARRKAAQRLMARLYERLFLSSVFTRMVSVKFRRASFAGVDEKEWNKARRSVARSAAAQAKRMTRFAKSLEQVPPG